MNFEEFKKKYQKVPVKHYPDNVNDEPMVSVCVQTYQHADYIKGCLEGVLMQKTGFPIEVLVGEDASTDGTREICIEYADKYPDKIRLILHKRENNIKIGRQPTGRFNFLYNLYNAYGQYIALCEGDDYWTDPLKLQKQVKFIESHKEAVMVAHQAEKVDEGGRSKDIFPHKQSKFLPSMKVIMKGGGYFATNSIMFNSKLIKNEKPDWFYEFPVGDTALSYWANEQGKIGFINELMSAYRTNVPGSWTSKQKSFKNMKRLLQVIKYNHKILKESQYSFFFV